MKDPAFLFYSSDFMMGVSDLTMQERGQYITLMCLQHQKGHLSEKTIWLSLGLASVSEIPDVISKFTKDENGLYYNDRLDEEIEKRLKYSDSRRLNGINGGRPGKKEKTICKPYAKPCVNHSENENINVNEDVIREEIGSQEGKFRRFWEAYPYKIAETKAEREFSILNPSDQLLEIILDSLEKWKKSREWKEADGKFIPYPEKWLREGMWESEVKPASNNNQNFSGVTYTDEQLKGFEPDPEEYLKKLQAEEKRK